MDLFMLPGDIRCRVLSLLFGAVKIHVVVQFYPWYNFDFPLFFSMLIYDIYIMNIKQRKIKIEQGIKLNYNIHL